MVNTNTTTSNINFDIADTVAPVNVSSATGSSATSTVTLNWNNPTDADFEGILVLQGTSNLSGTPAERTNYALSDTIGNGTVVYLGTGTTLTQTGLSANTNYFFKIYSYDIFKNYATGESLHLKTNIASDTTSPTAPQIITPVFATQTKVDLTWLSSNDPTSSTGETVSGMKGYKIYRDSVEIKITTGTGTAFTDTGVTAGNTYTYQIFAHDNANNSSAGSTSVDVTTPLNVDITSPNAPTLSTTVESTSSIKLTWTASSDPTSSTGETVSGISGYKLYRNNVQIKDSS